MKKLTVTEQTLRETHGAATNLTESLGMIQDMIDDLNFNSLPEEMSAEISGKVLGLVSLIHCLEVTARSIRNDVDELWCYAYRTGFAIQDDKIVFTKQEAA